MGYVWNLYNIQEAPNNQPLFGCNCSDDEDLPTGICTMLWMLIGAVLEDGTIIFHSWIV